MKDLENIIGQIIQNFKATGKMEKCMGKEFKKKKIKQLLDNGKMEN